MDSYELDNHAYEHMRKNGIHRTKKSGPRKGETVHETVGGKPFKHKALKTAQAKNMAPVDAPAGKDIKR